MQREREKLGTLLSAKKAEVEKNFRRWQILPADIPDLLQETYRRAFEYVGEHGVVGDPGALLQTISDGVAINHRAREKTRASCSDKLAMADVSSSNPEKEASQREINARLYETLIELPSQIREILARRLIEEQTTEQIARELGLSESTVKRRIVEHLAMCQAALRRRGITSAASFAAMLAQEGIENESGEKETTNPGVSVEKPKDASPGAEKPESGILRWCVASASAGGLAVWLLVEATNANREPRTQLSETAIAALGAPTEAPAPKESKDTSTKGAQKPDCPVCSDAPSPPTPPPCSNSKTSGTLAQSTQPEIDSSNRDRARACEASLKRGDKREALRWCPYVKGALREALQPMIDAARLTD